MMLQSRLPTRSWSKATSAGKRLPQRTMRISAIRDPATIRREERIPGKQLKDPVRTQGSHTYTLRVKPSADPTCSLSEYMNTLGRDMSVLQMPLGASISLVRNKEYKVVAPKVEIPVFNFWIQPVASTVSDWGSDFIGLESTQCEVKGSDNLPNVNGAFNLLVSMRFNYQDGAEPCVYSMATLAVDQDLPMPISLTPKPIVEGAGNAALETMLRIMLDGYMKNLSEDYERWQADPQLRAARAERAAAAVTAV
ncbi:hypothetical protein DUNSADRAFT_15524 [Dunaliella salina]|uniref:Uncharacterized protein n=1 Tax=Dunaliella salina TaxID=3046 RepID=A0ABQ7G588_DUNSA|nr:hypothetical protein DUNSADRAFT_15524 [Dunaliella salina]|eukprot:KAF5829778.1 hypothetical protein DUNSADRAFT_15524 [Dunaliella salina]